MNRIRLRVREFPFAQVLHPGPPPFDLAIVFMAGVRAFDEGQLVLHEEQVELFGQVGGEVIVANLQG